MRLATALAVLLVVSSTSCTRTHPPVEATGATAPPSSVAAEGSDLTGALVAAGVDMDRVPDRVRDLEDRPFCGSDARNHGDSELSEAARCFLDRHVAEVDAVYVSTFPTVEGDPITEVRVTGRRGEVAIFTDSTRDAFGSGEWGRGKARRLTVASAYGVGIDAVDYAQADLDAPLPDRAGDEATDWFVGRRVLRWCGTEVRVEDQDLDARACIRDAVDFGDPAEYVVGQTGDEGERAIRWFRVLGPGAFEVVERTLPGSGPAAGGSPAWRLLRCDAIGFQVEPGETAGIPLLDDAAACVEQ